ncbi:hypothetical protein [Tabrizicola soli]
MSDLTDFFFSTAEPAPSRQVRRAQERAAAKVTAREGRAAARKAAAGFDTDAFRFDVTRIFESLERETPEQRRSAALERAEQARRADAEREEVWRKRVLRQGPVPIEAVAFDGRDDEYLVAPSRPGNKPGTIRIRIFGLSGNVWTGERREDHGRHEVPMTPQGPVEPGTAEDLWFKLSAHKRMAMFAAVARRQIPPKHREAVAS